MFRIVFWDVLPCKIVVDRRFRGAYCLHHQASIILHGSTFQKTILNYFISCLLNAVVSFSHITPRTWEFLSSVPQFNIMFFTSKWAKQFIYSTYNVSKSLSVNAILLHRTGLELKNARFCCHHTVSSGRGFNPGFVPWQYEYVVFSDNSLRSIHKIQIQL
jgi:hypothetical protein